VNLSQNLIEELAIVRVLDTYTDGINQRDLEQVLSVFLPDATWSTVNHTDRRTFNGIADLREGFKMILTQSRFIVQMPTTSIVEVNGDTATARSTMHEVGDFDGPFLCYGTYLDKLKSRTRLGSSPSASSVTPIGRKVASPGKSFRCPEPMLIGIRLGAIAHV
jgi:ketosteroid isomerase-like protein